jgi:alkylhydroperoxidase family enzyme
MRLLLLTGAALALLVPAAPLFGAGPPAAPQRLGAAGHDEAWALLPQERPPLPAWARAMVRSLPKTTGFMLELDALHRARNPLGAALAGKLRWAAADAIGCEYARKYAEADLRRAKVKEADLKALASDPGALPKAERAALAFARKMTVAAHSVTDEEVADLLKLYGAEKVVAIVHTLAYANFQNRIFLALRLDVEKGGPLPPFEGRLDRAARAKLQAPARSWGDRKELKAAGADAPREWQERTVADLEKALAGQKDRKSRIPLPGARQLAKVPPEAKARASRIVWTKVSMGYQPELTRAWFETMGTFQSEARFDRVFSNTFFWVVTRSNECFY